MNRVKLVRGTFAALVAGTLGVGASQALAGPAPVPARNGFCSSSEQTHCVRYCDSLYGPFGSIAYCTWYEESGPMCDCVPV